MHNVRLKRPLRTPKPNVHAAASSTQAGKSGKPVLPHHADRRVHQQIYRKLLYKAIQAVASG